MKEEKALLTFGIGPVHTFIAQARRLADVWAGSALLSHLSRQAMSVVHREAGCEMVFPYFPEGANIPNGVPNRFVCRVPADRAEEIAGTMKKGIQKEWSRLVQEAVKVLHPQKLAPSEEIQRQAERLLTYSWSWVPERERYAEASRRGAERFAASRLFRPFDKAEERGEKCAICGERMALPDGDRGHVRDRWRAAEKIAPAEYKRFLREDQGRLCLVCATKRFYPLDAKRDQNFDALDAFQPDDDKPYFALVLLDGDRMGEILSLGKEEILGENLEDFHRKVSEALTGFASGLESGGSAKLNLEALESYVAKGRPPQLIYAGGDDVLLVCDARDALPLTRRIRARYVKSFDEARRLLVRPEGRFTISGAILFAHPRHPAGLLLRDLETLLEEEAKGRAGRNAVALRLAKRGGVPVEVAFPWEETIDGKEKTWAETLDLVVEELRKGSLSSRQTFTLRLEEQTLWGVFGPDAKKWKPWLTDRLSRNEGTSGQAETLAELVTPFFVHDRTGALRIARFLGREVER